MTSLPKTMRAMLLTRHGDFDALKFVTDYPVPVPLAGDVLIKVSASSVNNTDINTRVGWYAEKQDEGDDLKGGWGGSSLGFPRIQGTDICGTIVSIGREVDPARIGERVIVQACLVSRAENSVSPFVGSEIDGGFAEFAVVPAADAHLVSSELSDEELATLPCAYGTAENMIDTIGLTSGERVLITGASGNVGLAALQLAKLRGTRVHCLAAPAKHSILLSYGAESCSPSDGNGLAELANQFDCVIDMVGGDNWNQLFDLLNPFGRLAISGAIAGASTTVDLRKVYLKNLRIFGCTEQSRRSFETLISYLQLGRLSPPVHKIYPLEQLVDAQKEFLLKQHVGKIVIKI